MHVLRIQSKRSAKATPLTSPFKEGFPPHQPPPPPQPRGQLSPKFCQNLPICSKQMATDRCIKPSVTPGPAMVAIPLVRIALRLNVLQQALPPKFAAAITLVRSDEGTLGTLAAPLASLSCCCVQGVLLPKRRCRRQTFDPNCWLADQVPLRRTACRQGRSRLHVKPWYTLA